MAVKFDFKSLGEPFEANWPVRPSVPLDGGEVEVREFMARFRLLGASDFEDINKTDKDGWETHRRFLVGLVGEELTPELKEQLINTQYVREALMAAYRQFASGIAVKN